MKDRNGYVLKYVKEHPRAEKSGVVYEHVLVAEKVLGRYLTKEEVVHHIDLNRSNNTPENLMVFASNGDHTSFHAGNVAYKVDGVWHTERKRTKICPFCGKEYTLAKNDNYNRRKYCSPECAKAAQQKLKDCKIEAIQKLLFDNNGNFSKVGRLIGLSVSAIRKRLRTRNLPFYSKDYQKQ